MQFAYSPRKNSDPPPFKPRSATSPLLRGIRLRTVFLIGLGIVLVLVLLSRSGIKDGGERIPSGKPPVVIVTVIDQTYDTTYIERVKENREQYAALYGKLLRRVV
jgi:mannan polymerase II complex MNN11 subunit